MAEAEGVLLELAWRCAARWRGRAGARECAAAPELSADEWAGLQTELDVFLRALFGRRMALVPLAPARAPLLRFGWRTRDRECGALQGRRSEPLAGTDGCRLYLPLPPNTAVEPGSTATTRARLLETALVLGARIQRRSLQWLPRDPLARDLYWCADGAHAVAWICAELPGLAGGLAATRAHDRTSRRSRRRPTPLEQRWERFACEVLQGALLPGPDEPGEPLARWSLQTAAAWRRRFAGEYRGSEPIAHWGVPLAADAGCESSPLARPPGAERLPSRRLREGARLPTARVRPQSRPGPWLVPPGEPSLAAQPTERIARPLDRTSEIDLETLASELERAPRLVRVRAEHEVREILEGGPPPEAGSFALLSVQTHPTDAHEEACYPEWDHRARGYRPGYCRVRTLPSPRGDPAWARRVLREQQTLLRQLRAQADRLRPRPRVQSRQPHGAEIDVDAYVEEYADTRAGIARDGRIYHSERRARRDCAFALLLDASASTDRWLAGGRRVVDIEREAALLFGEATRVLADRQALYAFASRGPAQVRIQRLRRFGEPHGSAVEQRLAALEPALCTRLGAAIRHVTSELSRERARVRAILVVSDGRPSDDDGYGGAYAIEDARRAVLEALAQGIRPLCACIDPDGDRDPGAIFGSRGYRRARDLASLVRALDALHREIAR